MKTYKYADLRELYRVDNKYWKTGDVDILAKRMSIAQDLDGKFWSELLSITALATRKHLPVAALVEVLKLFGYEPEQMGAEAEDTNE